ncbi:MAG TPA: MbnP family protein, partial [Candidatus Krumholzibacteria bacterium]|nr:MbnP family protein [Candidatus Krumholzibacteria bacterium]
VVMPHATRKIIAVLLVAGIGAFTGGCGGDDTSAPEEPITVDMYFDFNVNGQPLIVNSLSYDNPDGRKYSIKTLRFVLTDVTIHSEQGNHLKIADLFYYNLADPTTQILHFTGGVPHADWNRVTFTFGLDETKNLRNKYISMTKFQQEMAWPTGLGPDLGYHYMQLEGNYEVTPGGATAGYTTHTGARHLDGTNPDFPGVVDATAYHHYFQVDLPVTPTHIHEGGAGEVTLHFDLNGWYVDHQLGDPDDTQYDFTDYPAMIMGNLEAQSKLQANGPFCFTASMESHGGHH